MLIDRHLQIKTRVFGHMTVGITVLRTKYGSNLVYLCEVGRYTHLFRQLRALC